MYDRKSNSLWSQALGEGIVGEYAGVKLERIPFDIAYWKEWKELYPESKDFQDIPVRLHHMELIHTETIILMI